MESDFSFRKSILCLAKLLLLNKASETVQPALANQVNDFSAISFEILDLKLIQIVLTTVTLIFTCYLLIKLILWTYDFLNTKFLHINTTGLTYWKALTMNRTNTYLHLYDFTTGDPVNLYLGTIFGEPEDILCEGHFVEGILFLEQKLTYDFIDLKWNTIALSLKDLDLPMPNTLQISKWKKTQVRKMFASNNSYFRIVAYSPSINKVRPITDIYNLQEETTLDLDDDQPTSVVQPMPLEVVVTDNKNTKTFNEDQSSIETDVPQSESDTD